MNQSIFLIVLLSLLRLSNSQNSTYVSQSRLHYGNIKEDTSDSISCYWGDSADDNLFRVDQCPAEIKWCLKLVDPRDSTDQLRQCDPGNVCKNFGNRCAIVRELNISSVNIAFTSDHLLCCCDENLCNFAFTLKYSILIRLLIAISVVLLLL